MEIALKEWLPQGLRDGAGIIGWGLSYLFRELAASLSLSRWSDNAKRLWTFYNLHSGQRCFILGNGPSLRQTDLHLLRKEFTFGLNRVYLLFPEIGFATTYLISINRLVLGQCAHEIASLDIPHFVNWRMRKLFQKDPNAFFLDTRFTGVNGFSPDPTRRVFEGYTVTYVATWSRRETIQIIFRPLILGKGSTGNFLTSPTLSGPISLPTRFIRNQVVVLSMQQLVEN